jgi:DNA-binding XRE family transcriptional regulator
VPWSLLYIANEIRYMRYAAHRARRRPDVNERRHEPMLPGFKDMAARRRALAQELTARRIDLGLTQTEVAARMGTSQSAVARVEAGSLDVRMSTLERYAEAVGRVVSWRLEHGGS